MGPRKFFGLFCSAAINIFKLGYLRVVSPGAHAVPLGGFEGLGCGSGFCPVRRFRFLGLRGLQFALDLDGLHHGLVFHRLHNLTWYVVREIFQLKFYCGLPRNLHLLNCR